jgi:hypothetical protein
MEREEILLIEKRGLTVRYYAEFWGAAVEFFPTSGN